MARLDLGKLNPPQREAVLHGEGPVLVLAGAGSGKTRVISYRIARLLGAGVPPDAILAMTFTNKAAGEMRERVAGLVGPRSKGLPRIGTFHAFGLTLVREQSRRLGFPGRVAIADGSDQSQIVRRALRDVRIDDRKFDLWRVLSVISRAKGEGRAPQPKPEGLGDDYDLIASLVFERYERALRAMGMVDFDDLIGLPVKLLGEDPGLLAATKRRFRHVLVDEFQDTSAAQLRLLRLVSPDSGNVCAVGDDDQSIYGWRGAEISNILEFERHFPGAVAIRLTQNYRSTGAILACANAVIRENQARRPKELWTDRGAGEPVQLVTLPGEEEEARFVAERIDELRGQGRALDDLAILFRTNAQSRPLEEALRERAIPYDVVGGPAFFDRKDVRDLVAFLKLVANPEDEVSLLRIVNVPARGIGEASVEKLSAFALERGLPVGEAFRRAREVEGLGPAAARVEGFLALLEELRGLFGSHGLGAAARALVDRVGLRAPAEEGPALAKAGEGAGPRADALEAVCQSLDNYARAARAPSLSEWLARLALDGRGEEAAPGEGGRAILMTLHAAKGLEFPVVFLVGMEEDLLPHGGMQGQPRDLDEERRLCYVGITRARDRLYLTRAAARQKRGQRIPRTPSRFLAPLPAEHVQIVDLAARATPDAASSKFWELVGMSPDPEA